MPVEDVRKFEQGNSIYLEAYYQGIDSTVADPSSPAYTVYDIKGNAVKSGTPSKETTGHYFFYWVPSSTGEYIVEFTGTIDTHAVKMREKIKIVKTKWKGQFSSSSSSSSSQSSSSSSRSSSSSSKSSSCSSSRSSSSSSFSSSSSSYSSSSQSSSSSSG